LLGLGYPGGPVIDRLAREGDPKAIRFPRATLKRGRFDFSFSGFKTALRAYLSQHPEAAEALPDVAASLQEALVDMLVDTTAEALAATGVERLVVAGGVAANRRLRVCMSEAAAALGVEVFFPRPALCTDNAAMIALAGAPRLATRLAVHHADNPRVRVLAGDVLALPLAEIVREPSVTVVANLPYNIATPVLFRLLDLRARFPRAVVMLQREMAARLAARAGS